MCTYLLLPSFSHSSVLILPSTFCNISSVTQSLFLSQDFKSYIFTISFFYTVSHLHSFVIYSLLLLYLVPFYHIILLVLYSSLLHSICAYLISPESYSLSIVSLFCNSAAYSFCQPSSICTCTPSGLCTHFLSVFCLFSQLAFSIIIFLTKKVTSLV